MYGVLCLCRVQGLQQVGPGDLDQGVQEDPLLVMHLGPSWAVPLEQGPWWDIQQVKTINQIQCDSFRTTFVIFFYYLFIKLSNYVSFHQVPGALLVWVWEVLQGWDLWHPEGYPCNHALWWTLGNSLMGQFCPQNRCRYSSLVLCSLQMIHLPWRFCWDHAVWSSWEGMFSAVVTDIPSTYKEYIIRVKQIGHFSVFFFF